MFNALFDLARPALHAFDPERAHDLALRALEAGLHPRDSAADPDMLRCRLGDLALPNPIGIAAGFDKDARVADAVLAMGCGFAEVGTLTPLAQAGNPRPRLFRLPADRAVINRYGFNNCGHREALARLRARRHRPGVVGVNVGANKDAVDRAADYVAGLEAFYDVAAYFTVNISSPNTPGLRDLQAPAALDGLLGRVMEARERRCAHGAPRRPVVVKIAPDIAEEDLPAITERLESHGVDMIAVSNTTLARPAALKEQAAAKQAGGLSGRPLFHRSTAMLARVYAATGGRIPLIGAGGIESTATAIAKLEAGATLLQLYTGLVFEGPGLIQRLKRGIADHCRAERLDSVAALTGRRANEWARRPLDG